MLAAFVALSLHPHALRKAQAELDAVVGSGRLPDFEDRDALPYFNALLLEVLRWHTVAPTSAPHYTSADEELRGFFVPAGTIVMPNVWYAAARMVTVAARGGRWC